MTDVESTDIDFQKLDDQNVSQEDILKERRKYLDVDEIEVIVYGIKDVYNRKTEQPRPLYVVFGYCDTYYKTSTIISYDPKWRESQTFDKIPLRMYLKEEVSSLEKEHKTLGKIELSLDHIPEEKDSRELLARFQPTEDNQNPKGYLRYECFVTRYRGKSHYKAVQYLKEQWPVFADRIYNFEWPSISCIWEPCMRHFRGPNGQQRKAESAQVDSKIIDALLSQAETNPEVATDLAMFPFMTKKSVKKRVRILEEKQRPKRWRSKSESNIAVENSMVRARLRGKRYFPEGTVTPLDRATSCPDFRNIPKTIRNKSVYRRAQRQSEIYEAISKRRKTTAVPTNPPTITSVEPNSGSVWGGTRLKIQGQYLGLDASDVTGLYVCGSSCLSTLHHESSEVVYCLTKPWRACSGPILVITSSGGRSSSKMKFTFYQDQSPPPTFHRSLETLSTQRERAGSLSSSDEPTTDNLPRSISMKDELDLSDVVNLRKDSGTKNVFRILNCVDEGTQTVESYVKPAAGETGGSTSSSKDPWKKINQPPPAEIEHVREENKSLKEMVNDLHEQVAQLKARNGELVEYVDELVAEVLKEAPDALCAKKHLSLP